MDSDPEDEWVAPHTGGLTSTYGVIPPIKTQRRCLEDTNKELEMQDRFSVLPPIALKTASTSEELNVPSTSRMLPHPPSTPKMKKSRSGLLKKKIEGKKFTKLPRVCSLIRFCIHFYWSYNFILYLFSISCLFRWKHLIDFFDFFSFPQSLLSLLSYQSQICLNLFKFYQHARKKPVCLSKSQLSFQGTHRIFDSSALRKYRAL